MSLSHAKFLDALAQIGLVPALEVETLKAAAADKLEADADTLAREMVEQGKLSRFQAAALYQGRAEALVLGNYLVIDKLGAGGMGQVFRARHRRMDRVVALKVLPKKLLASPEAVARFQREVKAAARLTHQHIVTAYDADEAAGMHYLVMEYVEGQDLSAMIKAAGPLSVAQAADYVVQAARGLEHAHAQGVIHRDVKPSNLLVDKSGTVKILDMGLARIDNPLAGPDSSDGLTTAGSVMGTVDFMSPEQALDTSQADARSDIYSLGCTLYYLLTSHKPYDGDTPMKKLVAHREKAIPSLAKARPEVPPAIEAVYRKMVAKRPENRYATMREARESLEAAIAGRPVAVASPVSSPLPVAARIDELPTGGTKSSKKVKPASSKMPLVAITTAVLILLGAGALIVPAMLSKEPVEQVALADLPAGVGSKSKTAPAAKPAQARSKPAQVMPEPALGDAVAAPPNMASPAGAPPAAVSAPVGAAPTIPAMIVSASTTLPPGEPAATAASQLGSQPDPAVAEEPAAAESGVPAVPTDPALERRAAEWALGVGARIEVALNGRTIKATQAGTLPSEPFSLITLDFAKLRQVNDQSLANLRGLGHLLHLNLARTGITNAAAAAIGANPHLQSLNFPGTSFGDAGVEQLPATLPLVAIQMNEAPISDRGAQSLARFKTLTVVSLINTAVTDEGVRLLSQLPLERLNLNGTQVTDIALKHLQGHKTLTFLALNRTAVSDAGLALIAHLPALRELYLLDTRITQQAVEALSGMHALTLLAISEPPFSPADYEKLRAALPSCQIDVSPASSPVVVSNTPTTIVPLSTANRLPVPTESDLQAALTTVRDVFGTEISAAKKPEDKAALAEKLFKQAPESRDDPASAYALLDEARRLAADAADARLLAQIDARLGTRFEVEPLELLADDLEKSTQKAHPASAFRTVCETALEQVDDALAEDNFALARRLSDVALTAARKAKDPSVLKSAVERNKSLAAMKQQWDAAAAAKVVLATAPDDPDANLAIGRYLCFVKSDWLAGFANLAKGSDDTLLALAARSLADPQDAAGQTELGEAWATAADRAKGKNKADLQAGARYWLAKALPASTGLTQVKIEQRLKQLEPAGGSSTSGSAGSRTATRRPPAGTLNQQLARDRAAAEWALGLGGRVGVMAPSFSGEQSIDLVTELPQQPFALVRIELSKNDQLSNDELKHLEGLTNLAILRIEISPVTDAGLVHLKDLTSLTTLSLAATQITDAGLVNLRGLTHLNDLWLSNRPAITGAGLETLKDLKNLKSLRLGNTHIDDAALAVLKNFPQLDRLRVNKTLITDAGIDQICLLNRLVELDLSDTNITDAALPKLSRLVNLKVMYLNRIKLSGAAVARLRASLPQCKVEF